MPIITKHRGILITCLIFGVIYSLISLVNHYYFRTFALDLGAYTNALYDYSHLQFNDSSVFKAENENLLASHFDLYLMILAPLTLFFGSFTLLIVQIFSILIGGLGVYRYFQTIDENSNIALQASVYFFLFFGVYSAISYDFHSNVVATMLIPWLFLSLTKRKLITASCLVLLIIISKENVSLWMTFISLGLLFHYRNDYILRRFLICSAIFCFSYFIILTSIVMPSLANSSVYNQYLNYSALGSNFREVIVHLISHPIESIKTLFVNHTNYGPGNYVKIELHILLLLAGLPFLFRKPYFLIMLIPIYFQKLFHDNHNMWGVADQYSIEFAPILAIGIFSVIGEMKNKKIMNWTIGAILLLCFATTVRIMDNPIAYIDKTRIRIYKAAHYRKEYDVKKVYAALTLIPKNAIVSSQSAFLPHLALRDNIYQFPIIKNADYIVYSSFEGSYPMNFEDMNNLILELKCTKQWKTIYDKEGFLILKRNKHNVIEPLSSASDF